MKGASVDKAVVLDCKCPICGMVNHVTVSKSALSDYNAGEYLQKAFPELDVNQRELIKTGICKKCWSELEGE
jgi:phage FluMu protein Com